MGAVIRLALQQGRQDRFALAAWIAGISGLGYAAATAVATQFGVENERAALVGVAAASPAFLFLRGLPDGIEVGAVTFFQGFSFTAVLAGLMSTFHVVRHTRADEDLGRLELLSSAPLSRSAPLVGTLLLGGCANLVLAAAVAGSFITSGLPVQGSVAAGAAAGAVGLVFTAAAALTAQIVPSARSANGVAAALVGAAYVVRGVGDALGAADASLLRVTPSWPSLLSPIGWAQRVRPFTETDILPLVILTAGAAALGAGAVALRRQRDLGASLVRADDAGAARAGAGLLSVTGLAWRLQRGTLAGWCITAALLGSIAGALGPLVRDALASNESLQDLLARLVRGNADVVDLFTTALLSVAGVIASSAGVQAVLRLRAEEAEGRAELLLAVPVSRPRWLLSSLIVAAASVAGVTLCAGAAAAAGLVLARTGGSSPGTVFAAATAHTPAALVFAAVAALAFALAPRWAAAAGWAVLALALVLGQFGELLALPPWLQDLSPFRHSSAMPIEPFNAPGALLMSAVVLCTAAAATWVIRERDLVG
ncbi:ABC transporter permease [Pseudarthrobacter enclensis]|uniref:ABC transporter permease n=1 Tax=Pseudarthrobacter enclensis TaxID=993070 RepID=UPI003EE3117E